MKGGWWRKIMGPPRTESRGLNFACLPLAVMVLDVNTALVNVGAVIIGQPWKRKCLQATRKTVAL